MTILTILMILWLWSHLKRAQGYPTGFTYAQLVINLALLNEQIRRLNEKKK